jgi:hypothetical protein
MNREPQRLKGNGTSSLFYSYTEEGEELRVLPEIYCRKHLGLSP